MATPNDLVRQMLAIAKLEAETCNHPKERCGAIIKNGDNLALVECRNVADNPYETFKISAQEWGFLNVDHEVTAIWHTHPNGSAAPTQADLVSIEEHQVPWHIVSWPQAGHSYTEPTGYEAPYLGRVFVHGIMDCYALVRDWYKRELGIELSQEERVNNWWDKGENLYVNGYEKNGLVSVPTKVRDLQRGDILLMQYVSRVPNHAGIYIGDGKLLHHVDRRLSEITTYGGYWMKHTTHYLRHKTQLCVS